MTKGTSYPRSRSTAPHALAAVLLGLWLGPAAPAAAHDFWIEPADFAPAVGEAVAVELRVGEHLAGDPVPRRAEGIVRFIVRDAEGEQEVRGVAGVAPAGVVRPRTAGVHVLAYETRPVAIELAAEKFERYLAEEGLERVSAERAARGESGRPGRELYSRSAKSLLAAGGWYGEGLDRPVGLPLELVPLRAPDALGGKTAALPVRLLFRGRPIAGVAVAALPAVEPAAARRGRTGPDGVIELELDRPGMWLVKAVHMEPAAAGSGADWESWWASLTLAVPQRLAATRSRTDDPPLDAPRVGRTIRSGPGR